MSTATATRPRTRPSTAARPERPLSRPVRGALQPCSPQVVELGTAPSRTRSRVHLTGRGRALVLLVLVALLFAAFAVGRSVSHASVTVDAGGPTLTQITVQSGDTLWSVSRRLAPHRDPREVVEQLQRLNSLPTSQLQVGQQLLLPLAV